MIIGLIHPGSGLGDQLFSYIVTRVIALDKGYDYGFVGKEFFKGKDFMKLNWGKSDELFYDFRIEQPAGKIIMNARSLLFEINKPYYDPEVNFVEDDTVIDGYGAQDERYWLHRIGYLWGWLKVEFIEIPDNVCIVNFRGGEFQYMPDLFLTVDYWQEAIRLMKDKYPEITFSVHTDDLDLATSFFKGILPAGFMVTRDIGLNWRSIRNAKHLILSNSAFGILPALLNENVKEIIAPRGWARRNLHNGTWSLPSNYYSKFTYI